MGKAKTKMRQRNTKEYRGEDLGSAPPGLPTTIRDPWVPSKPMTLPTNQQLVVHRMLARLLESEGATGRQVLPDEVAVLTAFHVDTADQLIHHVEEWRTLVLKTHGAEVLQRVERYLLENESIRVRTLREVAGVDAWGHAQHIVHEGVRCKVLDQYGTYWVPNRRAKIYLFRQAENRKGARQ